MGFSEESFAAQRNLLVQELRRQGIYDEKVLEAIAQVPRHKFVPRGLWDEAYWNQALPIAGGQTISQPYIVAFMTQEANIVAGDKVFEVGTGSGYQAAVLAAMGSEVYSVEIVEELAISSAAVLKELGVNNVYVKHADGYFAWEEHAPFDAILVTAAAPQIPEPLFAQLKDGGRIIMPLKERYGSETLVCVTKDENGKPLVKNLLPVRFVPMTGEVERATALK